jgi:hypothetical protein
MSRTINDFRPGLVAVLTASMIRYAEFAACLTMMERPAGSMLDWKHGSCLPHNANDAVKDLLAQSNEFDWLFLLNDDHTFDSDHLGGLLASMYAEDGTPTGKDIISAFYTERMAPFLPVLRKARGHEVQLWKEVKPVVMGDLSVPMFPEKPGLIPAFEVGCGSLLIRRNVLEAIEFPWFDFVLPNDRRGKNFFGEDIHFSRKARMAGFQAYIDTRLTYGHIGQFTAKPVWIQRPDGSWYQAIELNLGRGFTITMLYEEFDLETNFKDVLMGEHGPKPLHG